jgi:hypothetical protein
MTFRGNRSLALALVAVSALMALAACGGKAKPPPPPPPAPVKPPPPPPPPPPVCIPRSDTATITTATADAASTRFCVVNGDEQRACFGVDLESKTFETLEGAPIAQSAALTRPEARVIASPTEVRVCTGEGDGECKSLRPRVPKNAERPIDAVTDSAGTFAVLMLGDAEAGKGVAEVWDVARGKRTATIRYRKGDSMCGSAQVLGDVIFISASVCAGPAARGWLFSRKGKKLGEVGGKDFGTYGAVGVQVTETQWAFLEEGGAVVALQDMKTGKVERTIELLPLWNAEGGDDTDAPRGSGNPGESALLRGDDGKLVVIAGSPAAGTVGVVDIESGELTVIPSLPCEADEAPVAPAAQPEEETP